MMDHDKTSSNYRIWAVLSFKKINSGDAKTNPKTPLAQVVQPFLLITFPFVVLSQENILKKTEKWPWKYLQDKKKKNWELTLTKEVLIPIFLTYQVSVKLLWGKFWRRGVNFEFYRGAKNQLRKKTLKPRWSIIARMLMIGCVCNSSLVCIL